MFKNSSLPIDLDRLDHKKMDELAQHPQLINALDSWILAPDRELVPPLTNLGKIVSELYGFKRDMVLFRGFDPSKTHQDKMGLASSCKVGEQHDYRLHSPLSFSTSENIANAFGTLTVQATVNPAHTPALVITDELATLVSRLRNINPETQKEVIVFPPANIEFIILKK